MSKAGLRRRKSKNYRQGQQGFVLSTKQEITDTNAVLGKNSSCTTQCGDETMLVTI